MKIYWTNKASQDLECIEEYILPENPIAAVEQVCRVIHVVDGHIAANPAIGKIGRAPKTREFAIPGTPYIVIYRVIKDTIEIIRVLHGARQWPVKNNS